MKKTIITSLLLLCVCFLLFGFNVCAEETDYIENKSYEGSINAYNAQEKAYEQIPYFENCFYLTKLPDDELADFLALYEGCLNFEEKVTLPYLISAESMRDLRFYLAYETPWLIMYNKEAEFVYNYDTDNNLITKLQLTYGMDEDFYNEVYPQTLGVVEEISNDIYGFDTFSAELYVHDYLILNNKYHDDREFCYSPYGILVLGNGKCSAYASAVKWILHNAGIECYVVSGRMEGSSNAHAWNRVNVNGEFYEFDCTHDDTDRKNSCEEEVVNYGLFNAPCTIEGNNYFDFDHANTRFDMPCSESYEESYHYQNNCFVSSSEDAYSRFYEILSDTVSSGEHVMRIQFEDRDAFNSIVDGINNEEIVNYLSENEIYGCTVMHWRQEESMNIYVHIKYPE